MSEQAYLDDSSQWGDYSYVTMEQVINDYMANRSEDDYTGNTPRHRVVYQAMRGVRELYYDIMQEIKAIELDLSSSLQITLPEDYVNYVRISWVDERGVLYPMTENKTLSISRVYLQDNNFNILFDNDGNILETSETLDPNEDPNGENVNRYEFCFTGFNPNEDLSKKNPNGSYRIDKNDGVIRFSSDVFSKSIVLEYISDGLYFDTNKGETDSEIKVHKFAESALLDFIFYNLIKQNRHVPANEKARAKKEYYNSRRIAKRRLNQSNKFELLQAFKKSEKWIKGLEIG